MQEKVANKYRCTFIHSPDQSYSKNQSYGFEFMPTWIFTLAGHIPPRKDLVLDYYDTRFDDLSSIERADIFLFSCINQDLDQILKTRSLICSMFPDCVTVIGGPICWSFSESGDLELLHDFDHIIIGDGEGFIGDLVTGLIEGEPFPHITRVKERFELNRSLPYFKPFISKTFDRYHGVVIEVSRGCPFLCEFCDIRTMPDNNRAHTRPIGQIIDEMEYFISIGKTKFIFACDNLIGDLVWVEELLDQMILMVDRIGIQPNVYTWLTINLAKIPRLMKKMRLAGFDLLFIGIESFNVNSLLETAKVQNTKRALTEDIQEIQSYGFIVIAGLIFGFDTEGEDSFDIALEGLEYSGLLSGDPNFLTALPGTPLYRRMKLSNRLRQTDDLSSYSTGGTKYISNIKFLLPKSFMINGFKNFVRKYNSGKFQLSRLKIYYRTITNRENFIPLRKGNSGFAGIREIFSNLIFNKKGRHQVILRTKALLSDPLNIYYLLLGLLYVVFKVRLPGKFNQYRYWVFSWSNYLMKYRNVKESDFDFESVPPDFKLDDILPAGYDIDSATEMIPESKIKAQLSVTKKGLQNFIESARQTDK